MTLREYVYVAEQHDVGMKIPVAQKNMDLEAQVVLRKKKPWEKEMLHSGPHTAGNWPCHPELLFSYLKNYN